MTVLCCFKPIIQILYIIFLSIICPDSILLFLIIAFVYFDQAWSKRDQADENEANGVSNRRRKLTEKGKAYRATLLKERRENINGRMMRKCSIIEDLLFSNRIAVEEELVQFNDLFKMLLRIHEENSQVLDDHERADENDWFDDLDNKVCTFKRKIHSWLRSAETERKSSKGSSRSSESRPRKSSGIR